MIGGVMREEEIKNPIEQYQIFCDLDGVLVDLVGGVHNAIHNDPPIDVSAGHLKAQQLAREALNGEPLKQEHINKYDEGFLKPVRNFMMRVMREDRRFWMSLPWTRDGRLLWDYIKQYNPIVLSIPTDLQSLIGKKKWVKDNLGLSGKRVEIRYKKAPFAQYNGKTGLLIDDWVKNINSFEAAGGQTVHFTNAQQAIAALKIYGFDKTL